MNLLPKIAVTALAVLVLASCGKASTDNKDTKDDKSTSPSASSSPSESPSSTVAPAAGIAMSGTGYGYHLPDAWEDISAQLKQSQPGIDTGGRAKPATPPFTANMNTLTTPSQISGEPSDSDLDALAAQIKQEVASLAPTVQTKEHTTIAGAPAVHQEGDANSSGTKFYLVQYFAVYNGNNYGVTFAFPSGTNETARTKIIEPVLASWKWS